MPAQYTFATKPSFDKKIKKYLGKDRKMKEQVQSKISEILCNPLHYKPLRSPMNGLRRVHVGSYILTFEVDETRLIVWFVDYEHHDKAY
jgi:YafQ family addiction module toxin component